ncbi:MAG: hypothetical protein Q9162_005998 [Coniocarpon cinnabarinum]
MAVPETPKRIEEAKKQSKDEPQKAEQTFKDILSKGPGNSDASARDYENALMGLGQLYRDHKKIQELSDLVEHTRGELSSLPKAKTAKIVRNLLDLFHPLAGTTGIQISLTKSLITWSRQTSRSFLRQALETRLISLHLQQKEYYAALQLTSTLLKELKRLDDKLTLVEVQLLESRAYHALGNQPKARASLTSARTSAASVYTPPPLQAGLDMQSGMLHAEDGDFTTAHSYFVEALEGYAGQDAPKQATAALQYMLLCKIMDNANDEVQSLLASKHAQKFAGPQLEAMRAIANAHEHRSLAEYEAALSTWRTTLGADSFVRGHLKRLYDAMLEQNVVKVIEPFSRVEITHVAKMVGLDTLAVERKLSQMILDKKITGVLDQGEGCLIVFEEAGRDEGYDSALGTIEKLGGVVDVLFANQAALLE